MSHNWNACFQPFSCSEFPWVARDMICHSWICPWPGVSGWSMLKEPWWSGWDYLIPMGSSANISKSLESFRPARKWHLFVTKKMISPNPKADVPRFWLMFGETLAAFLGVASSVCFAVSGAVCSDGRQSLLVDMALMTVLFRHCGGSVWAMMRYPQLLWLLCTCGIYIHYFLLKEKLSRYQQQEQGTHGDAKRSPPLCEISPPCRMTVSGFGHLVLLLSYLPHVEGQKRWQVAVFLCCCPFHRLSMFNMCNQHFN